MFSLLFGFWDYLFKRPNLHVLIIGVDCSGKTTILERIKTQFGSAPGLPPHKIQATVGMNLAKIQLAGAQIVFWDLGGQRRMRNLWEKYYSEAHAVIFVVDSSDEARLEEAKLAYDAVCDCEELSSVPIITFANKQDVQGALTPGDLAINFYAIQDAADRRRVFGVSGLTGEGLEGAILAAIEEAKRNQLNRPVDSV